MSFSVKATPYFEREVKRIAKKHQAIKADIFKLINDLTLNPRMGTDLGQNIYKIRLAVSGTNKGKSGGARIITYVIVLKEVVYLSDIYLKSEHDTVDVNLIVKRLQHDGFI